MNRVVLVVVVVSLLWGVLAACERSPKTITVGFIGVMSGRSAGLGTDGRDGFLLAVNEINRSGGIGGANLVPLVLDSGTDPQQFEGLISEMRASGARAVVGPMRSQVATKQVPLANSAQLVMLSPTVSTDELQGKDDYFFRNYYSNRQSAEGLARLIYSDRRLTRVAVLYNIDNRAYTEDFLGSFRTALEAGGGEVAGAVPFSSLDLPDYTALLEEITASRPQGVLVLANAVDTAMFCQQLVKSGEVLPVFTTPWSFSDDLIAFGGNAVEGVTLLLSINPQSSKASFVEFRRAFLAQFGRQPRFSATHSYEATKMLIEVFRSGADSGPEIKQALLERGTFEGLQHAITFDAFGDINAPHLYPVQVAGGEFVAIP